jgi:stearoyl-CoA desaturase (delta-9 desaturase)
MFSMSLPLALVIAFSISQVANVVTTVYLHRALTHRAMTVHPGLDLVFRFVLWITLGLSRRQWVAVHRKHHIFTDQPEDPHSPVQKGVWKVLFLNAGYYRKVARTPGTVETYARDIKPDWWDRHVFSHSFVGIGMGLVGLAVLFGPLWALFIGVAHTAIYIFLGGCVNALNHHFGKRPNANSATNLRWVAALTMGEGMHNNHHEYPRSASFGRSFWDFGGHITKVLAKLKLVSVHESSRRLRQSQLDILQQPTTVAQPVAEAVEPEPVA